MDHDDMGQGAHGDARLQSLIGVIEASINALRSQGDTHWSSWLEKDLDRLRRRDFEGIVHFLSAFGGMGSLNDFPNRPEALLSRAHELAIAIYREEMSG